MRGDYHSLKVLEKAAEQRKPGYMEAVARLGHPATQGDKLVGYWLTPEAALQIMKEFNPDPSAAKAKERSIARESIPLPESFLRLEADLLDHGSPHPEVTGFDALLQRYMEELDNLGDCTDCEKNALRSKYRERLKNLLRASIDPA